MHHRSHLIKMEIKAHEITLIILGLFYGFFCLISLFRFFKILSEKKVYSIAYSFYIALFMSSLTRGGNLVVLVTKLDDVISIVSNHWIKYLILVIPDMVYIIVFLILVWHYLSQYITSHINVANDLGVFLEEDVPAMKKKTNYVLYGVIPSYIAGFILIALLYAFLADTDESKEVIMKIEGGISIATPFIFLGYYIFITVKFSGRPYRKKSEEEDVNHIFFVAVVWCLDRVIVGVAYIVAVKKFNIYIENISKISDIKEWICIVIYFIVTEFIPLYFALDFSLMKTFIEVNVNEPPLLSQTEEENVLDPNRNANLFESENESSTQRKSIGRHPSKQTVQNLIIANGSDIVLDQEIFSRKNGLGKLFKATYKGETVCCRVITFERLSRYDLEGISTDIQNIALLSSSNISPLVGLYIEENTKIIIVNPFYKNGSLFDYLHANTISDSDKIKIAIGIAQGLKYLHENHIYHLHLSSKNIYIDDDMTAVIGDYGFDSLKFNASTFNKYKNKNSYSSPEVLVNGNDIGTGTDEKIDVYSYGMILWELFTNTTPFDVELPQVISYVVEQKLRPKIENNIDKEIAELIRICWESESKKRPSIESIIGTLSKKM